MFNVCENSPATRNGVKIIQSGFATESAAKCFADGLNQKWADGAGESLNKYLAKRGNFSDEGVAFVSEVFGD